MLSIHYSDLYAAITAAWVLSRIWIWVQRKEVSLKRELQLLLVYVCIVVVVRFTFFPFSRANGQIQPLVFDAAKAFPPRINLLPLVYLFDYPVLREALLNLLGNTFLFAPLGIVWPMVWRQLDSHKKVLLSGFFTSLTIEILQLPFFDRVSDIDDLLLNTLGFALGYGIYLVCRRGRMRFLKKEQMKM